MTTLMVAQILWVLLLIVTLTFFWRIFLQQAAVTHFWTRSSELIEARDFVRLRAHVSIGTDSKHRQVRSAARSCAYDLRTIETMNAISRSLKDRVEELGGVEGTGTPLPDWQEEVSMS